MLWSALICVHSMHRNTRGGNQSSCPEWPVSDGRSYTASSRDEEHAHRLSLSLAECCHTLSLQRTRASFLPQHLGTPFHRENQGAGTWSRGEGPPLIAHIWESGLASGWEPSSLQPWEHCFCPLLSVKAVSSAVRWDCYFVSQESTESNLFYISHKLHPQRQSGILVIKKGTHGRDKM